MIQSHTIKSAPLRIPWSFLVLVYLISILLMAGHLIAGGLRDWRRRPAGEAYERHFACAVSAATATIGPIIPPSIPMVIFSMLSGASLGNLFLGGVIPGLVMGGAMMLYIAAVARRRKYPVGVWRGFRFLLASLFQALLALLTPVILIGGGSTPGCSRPPRPAQPPRCTGCSWRR